MKKKVIPYSVGLVSASACVLKGLSRDEIEGAMNEANDTGIDSSWRISKDEAFKDGSANPHQCEKDENREHYLFNC
jgi:hypothetical protein